MAIPENVLKAALAGLLHDVGKVAQRASTRPDVPPSGHEDAAPPVHAAYSQAFIQNHVPQKYHKYALHGVFHHDAQKSQAADKSLSQLVELADKLSAGERADEPAQEQEGKFPQQMVSIFERIAVHRPRKKSDFAYLPLHELKLSEEGLFPSTQVEASPSLAYQKLLQGLQQEAERRVDHDEAYLENLHQAFMRYTWCVPSAYYHNIPDVSLYDHSRMTAALAACMADWPSDKVEVLLGAVRRDFYGQATEKDQQLLEQPTALLVGGDISGVQDFIYTISSKGAAKTLRGRSFYLQLLTEAVLRFVLRKLELPYTNVIYTGGGHFFLLAPLSSYEKLDELRREISLRLIYMHRHALYLALGNTIVPAKGFRVGNFKQYWNEMHADLSRRKQQRYVELGDELYDWVFKPPDIGGNPNETCSVCGDDRLPVSKLEEEEAEEHRICSLCASFERELGKKLPQARFLALGVAPPKPLGKYDSALAALESFGLKVQLLEDEKEQIHLTGCDYLVIWALDDPKEGKYPASNGAPAVHGLRYTVNLVPPMTFDKLQEETHGGFERLGVLRMDVDNAGGLFQEGFAGDAQAGEQNLITLARLSTLSFQLSLFFEGWVKRLCEQKECKDKENKALVYAVYAGGDDLFLISPWDIMPNLAMKIRKAFSDYTHANPDVHLSGGMAFIHGKYPVYQAAEDAGEAEEAAKRMEGKDAFYFLGQPWKWSAFEDLSKKKEKLLEIVKKQDGAEGPQSILQLLRLLAASEAQAVSLHGRPLWGPWMWRGMYRFTRLAKQYENNKRELSEKLIELRDEIGSENYTHISTWGTAARWAQLLVRKK